VLPQAEKVEKEGLSKAFGPEKRVAAAETTVTHQQPTPGKLYQIIRELITFCKTKTIFFLKMI